MMAMTSPIEQLGFWAGVTLPLFDIFLIRHVIQRKSSADISLVWMWGIWLSSVLMAPSALISRDMAAIGFNAVNVLMLTIALVVVVKYRKGNI